MPGNALPRFIQRHPTLLQEADASSLPRSARRSRAERAAKEQRKERRTALYGRVQVLTGQGHTQHEIGQTLGIARGTVIRYQRAKEVPTSAPRERPREIDRYLPSLRERWEAGEQNAHTRLRSDSRARLYQFSSFCQTLFHPMAHGAGAQRPATEGASDDPHCVTVSPARHFSTEAALALLQSAGRAFSHR